MKLWSNAFIETSEWATVVTPVHVWRRITEENTGSRLIAKITVAGSIIFAALGNPIEGDEEHLYLPNWMLDQLGTCGEGEEAEVMWLSEDAFPEATRIVLRPHDSAFYHSDAKEELERALTQVGVLQQGGTLVIPLNCLGGFEVTFDVVVTEPANIVLAHGDEVEMEFEGALDAIEAEPVQAEPAQAEPIQAEPVQAEPVQAEPMVEETEQIFAPAPAPVGQALGGSVRLMPDGRRWNPWRDGPPV